MTIDALFDVTRAGLDVERARMDAASRRIAAADTPLGAHGAVTGASFGAHVRATGADGDGASAVPDDVHTQFDPSSPAADADGMVRVAHVDLAQEMTTLMSAQRAYQADIRAFNTLHGMMMKSLDIGRNNG